jgi:hypothetical protein
MRKFKARSAAFSISAAALMWLYPHFAGAAEETQALSASDPKGDPKDLSDQELTTGNYSKFPFHVSVSVRGGYDDNINTSKVDRQESWFTNAGAAITYDFGSARTQLSLQTGGGFTWFFDQPASSINNDYDVSSYLSLSVKHKASPRLTLSAVAYAAYQTEPDFSLAIGLNRRSGNFFYTQDKFTAEYLWTPRFSTATSYTFGAVKYDDSAIGLFEDRFENTFGNEFRFLIWPTTTLVAEYRFQIVNYDHQELMRDSTTHFALGGFDHAFSPRFSASFRGGAEFRDYDDANTQTTSPYFEGTLTYALGKDTTVSWTNRYGIEEPDVLLNPSRTTFRTGLRAKHDFTPRISGTLGAYYEHDDYDGVNTLTTVSSPFTEEAFDIAVALRYAINRYFAVEAGYNHTEVWSDIFLREYSRNRYWAGLNFAF